MARGPDQVRQHEMAWSAISYVRSNQIVFSFDAQSRPRLHLSQLYLKLDETNSFIERIAIDDHHQSLISLEQQIGSCKIEEF